MLCTFERWATGPVPRPVYPLPMLFWPYSPLHSRWDHPQPPTLIQLSLLSSYLFPIYSVSGVFTFLLLSFPWYLQPLLFFSVPGFSGFLPSPTGWPHACPRPAASCPHAGSLGFVVWHSLVQVLVTGPPAGSAQLRRGCSGNGSPWPWASRAERRDSRRKEYRRTAAGGTGGRRPAFCSLVPGRPFPHSVTGGPSCCPALCASHCACEEAFAKPRTQPRCCFDGSRCF